MSRKTPTDDERLALLAMCPRCEARPEQWCRFLHASRRRVVYETQAAQYEEDEKYLVPALVKIREVKKIARGLVESPNHRDRFLGKSLYGALQLPVPEVSMGPTS